MKQPRLGRHPSFCVFDQPYVLAAYLPHAPEERYLGRKPYR
ncbi:MAG: hypothetical protein AAGI38_11575 [Bacteroidota bacterium]